MNIRYAADVNFSLPLISSAKFGVVLTIKVLIVTTDTFAIDFSEVSAGRFLNVLTLKSFQQYMLTRRERVHKITQFLELSDFKFR